MHKAISPILFILSFIAVIIPGSLTNSNIWAYEIIAIASVLVFLFYKEPVAQVKRITFRPVFLFIFAFCIVFFQRPIDYIMGYVSGWFYVGETHYMPFCLKLAIWGLNAFLLGYLSRLNRTEYSQTFSIDAPIVSTKFYTVVLTLLLLAIFILVPRAILMGGYGQALLSAAGIYNYLSSWCSAFILAFLVQFSINAKRSNSLYNCSLLEFVKSMGTWQNFVVVLYTIMILNVGDRGPLIVACVAYYISYAIVSKKKLSKTLVFSFIAIGVVVSSFLGMTKQYRDNNSFFERAETLFSGGGFDQSESVCPPTYELSNSYNCMAFSVEMIDKGEHYQYGLLQIGGSLSAIPFINRFLHLPQGSSSKISHFVQGDEITYGNGTTCISDLYLDGGLLLVIIGMFIWGRLLRRFEVILFTDSSGSLFVFCMAMFFLAHVIYIPRSTILSPFKYALWVYIVMYLYNKMSVRNYGK